MLKSIPLFPRLSETGRVFSRHFSSLAYMRKKFFYEIHFRARSFLFRKSTMSHLVCDIGNRIIPLRQRTLLRPKRGRGVGGKALFVEQQKINITFAGFLEIFAEGIKVLRLDRDAGFKLDVCRRFTFSEETPASRFEQLVNFNTGDGFFLNHSGFFPFANGGGV